MLEVRRCAIAEIQAAPNLAEVLAEYAAESSLPELGDARAQMQTYRTLDASGFFHPIGAWRDGNLVGFILSVVGELPHYGVLAATVESFFVRVAERQSGLGLKLLAEAEELARSLGAKGLLISAPVGGQLARVLEGKSAYRHSNDVFVKALA